MTIPARIQRRRTKGWRMPPTAIYVGRGSRWGNPFRVTDDRTEAECAIAFSTWLRVESAHADMQERRQWIRDHLPELRGRDLACWCPLGRLCHADVLLELANIPAGAGEG